MRPINRISLCVPTAQGMTCTHVRVRWNYMHALMPLRISARFCLGVAFRIEICHGYDRSCESLSAGTGRIWSPLPTNTRRTGCLPFVDFSNVISITFLQFFRIFSSPFLNRRLLLRAIRVLSTWVSRHYSYFNVWICRAEFEESEKL